MEIRISNTGESLEKHTSKLRQRCAVACLFVLSLSPISNSYAMLCADRSASSIQAKASKYHDVIERYAFLYSVDINLVKAVITVESCFKPKAKSHAGARGLMQLMPATADRFGVRDSYNSVQNIRGGTKYLQFLMKRFDNNITKALAGYNAGEGNVDKYNGVPPFKETQRYVVDVQRVYDKLSGKATSQYLARHLPRNLKHGSLHRSYRVSLDSGFGANAGVPGRAVKVSIDPLEYVRRNVSPSVGSRRTVLPKGKIDPLEVVRKVKPAIRVQGVVANYATRKTQAHREMAAQIYNRKKLVKR